MGEVRHVRIPTVWRIEEATRAVFQMGFGPPPSVSRNSANTAPVGKGSGLVVRPFLHDILERWRVQHDAFEVLWTRQCYFCLLAILSATHGFNLDLRPAIGLWRISQAANDAAGVFTRDSQGAPHFTLGTLKTILYRLNNIRLSCRQVHARNECVRPLDKCGVNSRLCARRIRRHGCG
jgi:hypothetical protein